jgi:SAM-dependent methyltransferase
MIKYLLATWRKRVDADSSENRILNNDFLKDSYFAVYDLMQKGLDKSAKIIEIGGAGGVAKYFNSNVIVTDIRESKNTDMVVNGENLPFADGIVDSIWAKDAIHHMINPELFFLESSRVLKLDGQLSICEPYWSPTGKFIYKYLHPEIWSVDEISKGIFTPDGNQALAYCIFEISPENYAYIFDNFQIQNMQIVNGLSWILSGGATLTTNVPAKLLKIIAQYESKKPLWMKFIGLNIVITLKKIK